MRTLRSDTATLRNPTIGLSCVLSGVPSPKAIRPEEWVTGTGVKHVPDSLLIAQEQRPPEGYYPVT